mgnify:CR=1 FL=1
MRLQTEIDKIETISTILTLIPLQMETLTKELERFIFTHQEHAPKICHWIVTEFLSSKTFKQFEKAERARTVLFCIDLQNIINAAMKNN